MEWFHFSDFHIGRPNGPQTTALASLLDAIKIACKDGSGRVDAVFITGDIAYSGKSDEYESFCKNFLFPLKKLPEFAQSVVFAVPGNHDVDCEVGLPIAWETIGKRNQQVFFCENEEGANSRISRAHAFTAYRDFTQKNKIISPDPLKEVTHFHSDTNFPAEILATNTAFFSDRENSASNETAPSPIDSLRNVLDKRTVQRPLIILGHHPISCLIRSHQPPLTTFLYDKKAVFLHGHEHAPKATFNRDGTIRTLGFGAAYSATLQDQSSAPYFNTFTHCFLDTKLEIRTFSWQPSPGRWMDTTALLLPDCIPSNTLKSEAGQVSFPYISESIEGGRHNIPLSMVQRTAPTPTRLIPIDAPSDDLINKLFSVSSNIRAIAQKDDPRIRKMEDDDGKIRFELELEDGQRDLLIFIWAVNHVLSSKEVESVNTELDTVGFSSATVISLGKISGDASAMYLRLQARKPIEVLAGEGLMKEVDRLLSPQQLKNLDNLDAANHSICLLLGKDDIYLLVIDETQTQRKFHIVPSSGDQLDATDPVVGRLRKCDPDLAVMDYAGESKSDSGIKENSFQEDSYLKKCHQEYNVVKYAALANAGMRFTDLPLESLYVNATASEVSDTVSSRAERVIEDHLAAYPVNEELRDHIQDRLIDSGGQIERQETSRARDFCQKYSAVLITGDPGSGKTCFVKSEILAYCKRGLSEEDSKEGNNNDWHSFHVPILVPLSELVAEDDFEVKGIFGVASRLLERRGLFFPEVQMRRLSLQGRLALFFDGLDEVVSVEKRALVVKQINEMVVELQPTGNRIAVTSRPAAVQVVNLLPVLQKLELQGLTETEIRTLAKRLLTSKLAATQTSVRVDEGTLVESDHILISQLINDCQKNPGVSRMAQNPLLLTLLIMIYANSGAPSAKRHRIYEEAIKTLASVRGREAGHQPISVQDLRERLGAVALSVYKKESGLLPDRAEVCEVVRCVMTRQRHEEVSTADANAFIQKVAESTGLIALESRQGEGDNHAIVTFMHHSFLEYFAAIGLSRELEITDISALVREPRWREILTLLAGIIGENKDVSPIINLFLSSACSEHDFDAKILLFAIDCALECEVPSEAAQRVLSNNIKECITNGPAKLDHWVRSEIGQRLNHLLSVCGGSEFDGMITKLIINGNETVCAAAIDILGHACENGYQSKELMDAFEKACARIDDAVLSAICLAASRARILRTNAAQQVIATSVRKSRRNRQAAFEALARVPSLATLHWDEIISGIDDKHARVSMWASLAAMQAGLNVDVISLNSTRKDVLFRALNLVDIAGRLDEYRHPQMKKDTLNKLLGSALLRDRILGIRLIPLATGEEKYAYDTLIKLVQEDTPREELGAALIALRWSDSARGLFTLGNLRSVAHWLKNGTADVRVAAADLLGCFGKDKVAIEAILSQNFDVMSVQDYCASMQALSKAGVCLDRVRELIFQNLRSFLDGKKKMSPDNLKRTKTLLDASRRLGESAPSFLVDKVSKIIDDYRANDSLKRKALLCYPAIARPSQKTVGKITNLCLNPPLGMEKELVQTPSVLAKKCRGNIDYVVASASSLAELRVALLSLHAQFSLRPATEENEFCISELRKGIEDITQIIVAFQDFISNGGNSTPMCE